MDVFGGAPRFLAYPRPVVVQSGTDAVLKCQISGDPRPAVIWERNNEKIHPGGRYRLFEDGNIYNLIITVVTAEDSGQYICKAKNCIGETYAAATLKVEGEAQEMELREENKPRFLIKPLSTRVGRGDDAVFSCKLWGKPRPEVVWEKDGKKLNEIFESTHFSVGYQDGGWFQLKIFKTRAPDGGVYTCKARNEFGESLAGAVLLVDAGPGHEDEGNRNGYTNGHWKAHQGKQRSSRHVVTRLKEDPVLTSAKVKMFAVTEGKHAKFRCYVTGKPKPEIIWRKDGRIILSGRRYLLYEDREGYFTLKVLYCKQQDNGVYVCAASNTAGQTLSAVHLFVKEPPVRFKQPLNDLEVWERDLAILECEVPEDSVPITWYLEDRRLQPGAKYGMEEWGTKRRLTIRDMGVDDDGIYLCEMPDGGRSIAEVTVKGTIVRKLPRKVDVLEGENAAFCVEVEEEEMDIHWYKDGTELRETHQTIIKSFGRTHILVFVNTTPQDSGMVIFYVGRSKTSSQLRVKAVRQCPPSCPVGVQINTERANAALLSWVPAQDCRKNPPSGYILERQEIGSQEWLQCLTTDSATSVEILGDSVPCEADYRFRICSINKYGRSGYVEFPRAVHLVPVAKIQAPLQDALVPEGQDAYFSIELSASVIGTWFWNGNQVQEDERFLIRRSRTHQSLRIRGVRDTDNGAEITFIAYGIRDSAALYIQAPLVKFTPLSEMDRNKFVEVGNPIVLYCELSDPEAPVRWYKNGVELHSVEGLHIQSEGTMRRIVIQSAEFCHSGVYSCDAIDDVIRFNVEVEAPTVMFSTVTEAQRNKSAVVGEPFELECEVSDAAAYVCWYKDGNELSSEAGVLVTSEGTIRKLSVQSAELCHSGTYNCKTDADAVTFNVDIKASSTRFKPLAEMERNRSIELDSPTVPKYEISDSESQVCWYNDGTELLSDSGLNTQRDGNVRKLTVQSTELSDTGHFICGSPDDAVSFKMASQATPIRFSALPDVARNKFIEAGCPIILQCEISESAAQVSWFKDGVPLLQETGLDIKSEGTMRALIIQSAELKHSGTYSCEAGDDRIAFKVDVAASPVRFTAVPETEKTKSFEAGSPIILQCEISEPTALVQWYKDGTQLFPQSGVFFQSEHTMRTLVILSATFSHSGVYSCSTADDISEFYVDIKAPAVTFVYIPKEELHRNVVEQDKLFLCCEVSRSDAITQWYKDGVEIQTCNKVIIETENTMRKLIIPSVQMSDAGTYTCRAGGSALIFKVNVREPPVMIVYPKEDVHLDRHVPEEIVLSCELSRPNGKVTWFKDGQKLQESENMKLKTEGPYRRLKILHSRVEDSGEYVCDTADDSKFFHLSIKEPPVRIVSPSQSQMELCQQMSERMVLSCEISRANASVRWYRNGLEVEENNNLILEVDGIYRRLIIPETTVSDSAEYVCDTADDSVTFFVNIAEPPVRFIRPRKMAYEVEKFVGETIVLDCEVSRSNAEVSWKKNGEEIEENSNITITEDGCTRQLTIHSSRLEDTGQYLCDAKDDVMDFSLKINDSPLKFLHKSAIITDRHFVVSDAIVLKCELSRANGVVCWYKDNNRIVLNDHVTFEEEGAFRSLIILNAEIGDTGEYICNAKDDELVFNITVQEAPVSILRNPRTPEHYSLVAGNELILECEVSRENATVHWLCNGKVLQADARINIERRGTMRKLVLSNLQVSDSGEYICDAIDDKMNIMVTVQEPPFKFIKKEEINIDAYEEESVTLCAEVNRDNGSVQWSKGGKKISDHRFYATSDGPTHYLTINHLKKSDAGEYECDVGTDKAHFSIQVKAMKVKFSKPLQNIVGLKGSDAVLRCELHKSKGDVQWLKNNQEITPNRHFTIRADGQERSLTIHNITDDDEGEYTCESKDERTCATLVVKTPRVVEFIAELHNITVMEGEDATFKCVVSPEDAKMVWCRNGWPITSNERFKISSNGLCHMLYIRNCQVSDSCKLTAEAEGVISKAILQVQEKQVLFTKKMESVVAEEFGEATLEVELSLECGEVQWMRQGVVIHPGPKFAPKQCGQKRMLTIHKLALSDRGTYSCETLHDRTQAVLSVEPRKVKIRKGLREIQTFERETASFEVELTHSNVEGMWLKDGNRLKSNNHWRMTTKGRVHSLTIANLSLEDTGTYTFSTENARSSARLTVKEIPVSILKKLEDSTFPEGTGATLECELSKYNVTVKWTKNGEELKPGKNHRIYSMGRKCFLQILRCELGDSGVYVCDAGDATTSCSVEVYERDLEVLHSLEDLDIQEDQNAVFMCEVSLDDVPGEWFKNGEKIKPTSTIRIRQEGTKHFLLMCNVKEEDSGEIKFVAKNVESVAYLEVERLPVNIVKPLQDKTALENTRVLLDCTVSNPRCSIRWYKGRNVILPSERFEICSEGCYRKLVIQEVTLEDAGMYSVQVGENTSSARLTVEAQPILMVQELQDVEVSAPEEACFMCEVSVPVVKSPMWTLNGEVLRPGPKVLLERMETVHKLTLKHTSEDMNGVVVFDSGKAKSTANLRVKK
ncbi:obscurin isoform X10 [Pangasianodon hypophthalmus]|uniref:obscurin isoform X10 n=1 Tax=Pangasianodon hypophthalmus TaxID=310915 RepID=UPI000EFF5C37|nr:obscurin isoform X10 [Pangasianodon hypophthalmus]